MGKAKTRKRKTTQKTSKPRETDSRVEIVGAAYEEPRRLVVDAARGKRRVLLIGERGSGKELFGDYYKRHSPLKGNRRTVNCSALAESVLESEVFGHVEGAFTGANKPRNGLLKTCEEGILCVDELGASSPGFQKALLRVAEGHSYKPVGSDDEKKTKCLIIASTNEPQRIRDDIKDRFRIIEIPPLWAGDIPCLAQYFIEEELGRSGKQAKGRAQRNRHVKTEVLTKLTDAEYPGNVRGLKAACEQMFDEFGKQVFCSNPSPLLTISREFDYARFRREYAIWNKCIKPAIERYGLDYSYRYFDNTNAYQQYIDKTKNLTEIQRDDPYPPTRARELVDAGGRFSGYVAKAGVTLAAEEVGPILLGEILGFFLSKGFLPTLLKRIEYETNETRPAKNPLHPTEGVRMPNVEFSGGSLEVLTTKFKIECIEYHVDRNNGDWAEAARDLGLSGARALKEQYRRAKEKSQTD